MFYFALLLFSAMLLFLFAIPFWAIFYFIVFYSILLCYCFYSQFISVAHILFF